MALCGSGRADGMGGGDVIGTVSCAAQPGHLPDLPAALSGTPTRLPHFGQLNLIGMGASVFPAACPGPCPWFVDMTRDGTLAAGGSAADTRLLAS